jgi:hypothetical protein
VRHFQLRLLALVLILAEKVFSIPKLEDLLAPVVIFTSARFAGVEITGDYFNMNLREGQQVNVTAALRTRAGHRQPMSREVQRGKARTRRSRRLTVDPTNELSAKSSASTDRTTEAL